MQLLQKNRLRKFNSQAPLADIFVRETDWQKDDQLPIANDDLHAESWNTNFGSNTFDDSPSKYSQNTEDTEYIPIQIPKKTTHHPQNLQQIEDGAQWNRPLNQMKITRMKLHNKSVRLIKKTQKTQNDTTNPSDDDIQKTPEIP